MSRFFACAVLLSFSCGVSGCTLITDVDRSKIASTEKEAPTGMGGMDGGGAGERDAGLAADAGMDAAASDAGASDAGAENDAGQAADAGEEPPTETPKADAAASDAG